METYLKALAPVHPVLSRMAKRGEDAGFPIIGPLVGRYVAQWARAIGARRVLEMGSGFGYSTGWFAQAVGAEGLVVHTDTSAELSAEARGWMEQLGVAERVRFELGDALAVARLEDGPFDVVFIDIDKDGYPEAWDVASPLVRPGGVVIADNALWRGQVVDAQHMDATTEAVRTYLRRACRPGWETTVVPLRDGVAVSLRV